jgi:hypothetical protein
LQKGYNLAQDTVGFYKFETDHGLIYYLFLIDYSEFWGLPENSPFKFYEFGFSCENREVYSGPDPKVEETVTEFVVKFLSTHNDSILYVASQQDGKQKERYRLFDMWYSKSNLKTILEKHKRNPSIMLVHKDNPFKAELVEIFYNR